jgi:hypothetical protein
MKTGVRISFQTIDWNPVPQTEHKGETGKAFRQAVKSGELRIRYGVTLMIIDGYFLQKIQD